MTILPPEDTTGVSGRIHRLYHIGMLVRKMPSVRALLRPIPSECSLSATLLAFPVREVLVICTLGAIERPGRATVAPAEWAESDDAGNGDRR